jgi:DNA invertase Pin-like site-specific DNA recombinase
VLQVRVYLGSELVMAVKAAIDQMEGRKIGYRTYRSLRERHRAAHRAGGRVCGYSSVEEGDYRRRVVDDAQAQIVREIFGRFAAGEGAKSCAGSECATRAVAWLLLE